MGVKYVQKPKKIGLVYCLGCCFMLSQMIPLCVYGSESDNLNSPNKAAEQKITGEKLVDDFKLLFKDASGLLQLSMQPVIAWVQKTYDNVSDESKEKIIVYLTWIKHAYKKVKTNAQVEGADYIAEMKDFVKEAVKKFKVLREEALQQKNAPPKKTTIAI